MRCLSLPVVAGALCCLTAIGCQPRERFPQQVSERLGQLQQKINLASGKAAPTENFTLDQVPAWQKFAIKEREIFKPLETSELSEAKVVVDAYQVQLKGIVVIGRQPKAIVAVNDYVYLVNQGQWVSADILLQQIYDDGVDLQRSYKKVYLGVGQREDI